jgi:hypothetical protein
MQIRELKNKLKEAEESSNMIKFQNQLLIEVSFWDFILNALQSCTSIIVCNVAFHSSSIV